MVAGGGAGPGCPSSRLRSLCQPVGAVPPCLLLGEPGELDHPRIGSSGHTSSSTPNLWRPADGGKAGRRGLPLTDTTRLVVMDWIDGIPLTYRPLRNRETRGPCSGPLAGKDFGAQLVVSL